MFKSKEDKKIESLAKQIRNKDKRLSWGTCVKKAKAQLRLLSQYGGSMYD